MPTDAPVSSTEERVKARNGGANTDDILAALSPEARTSFENAYVKAARDHPNEQLRTAIKKAGRRYVAVGWLLAREASNGAVNKREASEALLDDAESQGANAARQGVGPDANPYVDSVHGSGMRDAWEAGWDMEHDTQRIWNLEKALGQAMVELGLYRNLLARARAWTPALQQSFEIMKRQAAKALENAPS